jgi:hypothetical protein
MERGPVPRSDLPLTLLEFPESHARNLMESDDLPAKRLPVFLIQCYVSGALKRYVSRDRGSVLSAETLRFGSAFATFWARRRYVSGSFSLRFGRVGILAKAAFRA